RDSLASTLAFHLVYAVLDQPKNTVEIDGERTLPVFFGHLIDGQIARRPNAVICNQAVESAESPNCRVDELFRVVGGGQFLLHSGTDWSSALGDDSLGSISRFLVIEDHLGAGGAEHLHRCRADAARASGDQSNFSGKRKLDSILETSCHQRRAITSISTSESFGNRATSTVDRAGETLPSPERYRA